MPAKPLRLLMAALALSAMSSPLAAQPWIIYSLDWMEVDAGTNTPVSNPNGILEPGEGARIMLSAGFTPEVGQPINDGIMAGLGTAFLIMHTGSSSGSWSHVATASGFDPWFNAGPTSPTQFWGAGGYQYGTGPGCRIPAIRSRASGVRSGCRRLMNRVR
jgi:hypothetical protein